MSDSVEDWDFHEETVIGHHVAARIEEQSEFSKRLDEASKRLGLERKNDSPMVRIEVGDVDWDENESVRVRLDTLKRLLREIENE